MRVLARVFETYRTDVVVEVPDGMPPKEIKERLYGRYLAGYMDDVMTDSPRHFVESEIIVDKASHAAGGTSQTRWVYGLTATERDGAKEVE